MHSLLPLRCCIYVFEPKICLRLSQNRFPNSANHLKRKQFSISSIEWVWKVWFATARSVFLQPKIENMMIFLHQSRMWHTYETTVFRKKPLMALQRNECAWKSFSQFVAFYDLPSHINNYWTPQMCLQIIAVAKHIWFHLIASVDSLKMKTNQKHTHTLKERHWIYLYFLNRNQTISILLSKYSDNSHGNGFVCKNKNEKKRWSASWQIEGYSMCILIG